MANLTCIENCHISFCVAHILCCTTVNLTNLPCARLIHTSCSTQLELDSCLKCSVYICFRLELTSQHSVMPLSLRAKHSSHISFLLVASRMQHSSTSSLGRVTKSSFHWTKISLVLWTNCSRSSGSATFHIHLNSPQFLHSWSMSTISLSPQPGRRG